MHDRWICHLAARYGASRHRVTVHIRGAVRGRCVSVVDGYRIPVGFHEAVQADVQAGQNHIYAGDDRSIHHGMGQCICDWKYSVGDCVCYRSIVSTHLRTAWYVEGERSQADHINPSRWSFFCFHTQQRRILALLVELHSVVHRLYQTDV